MVAGSLVTLPNVIARFVVSPDAEVLGPWSGGYWIVFVALVVFWTFLLTSCIFNARNMLRTAERWGYGIPGGGSLEECRVTIERMVARRTWATAVSLCIVGVLPWVFLHLGVLSMVGFYFGAAGLASVAIILDTVDSIRMRVREARDPKESDSESENPWVPVLSTETWLEIEMARRVLEEAGIDSVARFNRAISATGSLAPWEVCRPTFPSLVVYRGLGGGRAMLLVRPDEFERAQALLARFAEEAP
jgi:hypothetical protein